MTMPKDPKKARGTKIKYLPKALPGTLDEYLESPGFKHLVGKLHRKASGESRRANNGYKHQPILKRKSK